MKAIKKFISNSSVGTVLFALIILCIVWGCLTPYFFTLNNARNLAIYSSYLGIMACGLTFPLLTGCVDLSQMPMMAMCGMIMAISYQKGVSGFGLFIVAAIVGILAGMVNAFIVTFLHIIPFIATVGTQLMFRALAFIVTDGVYITVKDNMIHAIGFDSFLGIPIMFYIMAFIFLVCWFVQKYLQFGRNLYSLGSSEQAAHLSGINVRRTRFIAYMCSGLLCGIAAVVYTAQSSVALNNAGQGSEMDITASVVIGGVSMAGGRGNVFNVFLGVILMSVLANGMGLLGMNPYLQMFFKGLILVIAVYLDTLRDKMR